MNTYYVYAYLREDGTPYYIGKGKKRRAVSQHDNLHIPTDNTRIVFLENNLTNVGALALERRYIEWYGRKCNGTGILRNLTPGGDGNTGPRSKEWCENHSRIMKAKGKNPKISEWAKNRNTSYMQTQEYRKKISEAKKGKPNYKLRGRIVTEETKEKIRQSKLKTKPLGDFCEL